jgi:hypothetical protein
METCEQVRTVPTMEGDREIRCIKPAGHETFDEDATVPQSIDPLEHFGRSGHWPVRWR